jgi:hypothetical protein
VLEDWTRALLADLGLALDVDEGLVLELARDAAHGVARPAAPLTTFLVGYAAGLRGGGDGEVRAAAGTASALAGRWRAGGGEGATHGDGPADRSDPAR